MTRIEHPAREYFVLPGIAPYSCGVVAARGYEIVHVGFQSPVPWREGFAKLDNFLASRQQARTALCAVELRSPRPYSFAGFAEFNAEYAALLRDWGVFIGDINPIARTNVAPMLNAPAEPMLYGFSFTSPCPVDWRPTFVVAGAGELPEGELTREAIVALGDVSPAGMATKARFVMDLMENRLQGLGVEWRQASAVNVYTPHSLTPLMLEMILSRVGAASIHGLNWHFSRPPVDEIEFEMDVRSVRVDLRIA